MLGLGTYLVTCERFREKRKYRIVYVPRTSVWKLYRERYHDSPIGLEEN